MSKVITALAFITHVVATYPALSAALVNIGVVAAAYFGLSITGAELIFVVGVVTTLFGALVHSNVTPLAKLKATAVAVEEIKAEVTTPNV